MSQKRRIIEALKQRMKTQRVTYKQMALKIGVSEATMKRYLAQGRFTLDTLDRMCEILSSSLEELFEYSGGQTGSRNESFSTEQEQALADNDLLFVIFYLVDGGWTFSAIVENFKIGETLLTKLLVQLDRHGLIDYHSNSSIRRRQHIDTQWIPSGPLWMKYKRQAVQEFFKSDFGTENEYLKVTRGPVSMETVTVVRRKLARVQKDIQNLLDLEEIPSNQVADVDRYWFVTAMRPMSFSAMSKTAVDAALDNLLPQRL